jgi:hypothetical protein
MNPYATATGIAFSLLVVWATLAQFQAPAGADALQSIPEGLRAEGALIPLAWPLCPRVSGCVWRSAPIDMRWSPKFGQEVKLGLLLRKTDLNDEQTETVFG